MRLEITVVAAPGAVVMQPVELSVELAVESAAGPAADGEPVGFGGQETTGFALRRALGDRWPGAAFTVAGRPLAELHAGRRPLVDGAVVVVHGPGGSGAAIAGAAGPPALALLTVLSGPGSGEVFPLHRGVYRLGRGSGEIRITDPALSRHHGTLTVGDHDMTLATAAGSSGFLLHRNWAETPDETGTPVRGSAKIHIGDVVRAGMTGFAVILNSPERPGDPEQDWARLLDPAVLEPISVRRAAAPAHGRWLAAAAGLLPLAAGVLFAVLTGSWMFVALAAMGAVTVLVPLLGGTGRRADAKAVIAAAARLDAARRLAAFPGADVLLRLAHSHRWAAGAASRDFPAAPPPAGAAVVVPPEASGREMVLRVGTGRHPASVRVAPDDPRFVPPLLAASPIAVPITAAGLAVTGPDAPLRSLLNFILMQLDAAGIPAVLLGPPGKLPLSARFLPSTVLAASAAAAVSGVRAFTPAYNGAIPGLPAALSGDGGPPPPAPRCVLLCLGLPPDPVVAACPGLRHILFGTGSGSCAGPRLALRPDGNVTLGSLEGQEFIPDGVPAVLFDRYARARGRGGATATGSLELSLVPARSLASSAAVRDMWRSTAGHCLGPVRIGQSAAGEELFDFSRDGPHLLVAGTTGSGKSELLRTLVGSLAATHSPACLQFVFIDFKGGAGLGALGKFPHTSSLVTDLAGHDMDRTLASLRAEIRRREALLGTVAAADAGAYRASVPATDARTAMAHLLVVVDEFRILVDQYPEAMAELMRIAAVGRSLGIHLVLATQRPQGAVNADIRANVTSSICLRVQSAADSRDVIGSPAAAGIDVGTPGRAFISRAGTVPTEFQCATLGLPAEPQTLRVLAVPALEALVRDADPCGAGPRPGRPAAAEPAGGAEAVAALLTSAWATPTPTGLVPEPARAVVAPGLPPSLDCGVLAAAQSARSDGADTAAIVLGLVDVPELQLLKPLCWSPSAHSHLAFIGSRSGGSSAAVALVMAQLTAVNALAVQPVPEAVVHHLYVLDGDGSLAGFSGGPWVGAHVTPLELRTAARLLQRLSDLSPTLGASAVVCITDWGRWVAAFRSSPWPWAEDAVTELIRHGGTRIVVVISGERELLTAPFMTALSNRVFLPHSASPEFRLLWPRLPKVEAGPGRGAVLGPINAAASQGQADDAHVVQLGTAPAAPAAPSAPPLAASPGAGVRHPLVVTGIPEELSLARALTLARSAAAGPSFDPAGLGYGPPGESVLTRIGGPVRIIVGIGGDGADPVTVSVPAGTFLPVVGGPHSGRSTFIAAVRTLNESMLPAPGAAPPLQNPGAGVPVLWMDDVAAMSAADVATLSAALAGGAVVIGSLPNHLPSLARLPAGWGVRTADQAIVLLPRRPADGEMFGVRLDTTGSEPIGRGVLIDRGHRDWFQFPALTGPGARRRSAGKTPPLSG
ncbi:FtsK/SpoIIIE domain-containing protein [Specibacter sp. RAF43]|uniref:FtsK/SpoIIIE domain-containing protein n=1 Tax=Specibacter sp. RAF43 TaxID=3233057 RepID=UPI003F9BB9AB